MSTVSDSLARAITIVGLARLAAECGVTYQAVRKWQRADSLPRTEWNGDTSYALTIARVTHGAVCVDDVAPGLSRVLDALPGRQAQPSAVRCS